MWGLMLVPRDGTEPRRGVPPAPPTGVVTRVRGGSGGDVVAEVAALRYRTNPFARARYADGARVWRVDTRPYP